MMDTKIEYITAKRFTEEGEVDSSINALLLITISDRCSGENKFFPEESKTEIEKMEITVLPISKHKQGGSVENIIQRQVNNYDIFDLTLDHRKKTALFFDWDIIVPSEMRNFGIGKYVTSKLIQWGNERAETYRVRSRQLSSVDASSADVRDHRNYFYQSLGFSLDFKNDPVERKNGRVFASTMSQLIANWNDKKIEVKSPESVIYLLENNLSQKRRELENLKKSHRQYFDKYYDTSSRFNSLKRFLWLCGVSAGLLAIVYISVVNG